MNTLTYLDLTAFFLMLIFWLFYDAYARNIVLKKGGKTVMSVANSLRAHWIHNLLLRPAKERIPDVQLSSILHRGVSFFISITVFIIAGLMTMLISSKELLVVLEHLPLLADNYQSTWNVKISAIILIFVVAFFRLTWSLRQNQYFAIACFGAPHRSEIQDEQFYRLIKRLAKLGSDSGKNFNNALRSYYFGLSMMLWLIHPIVFMAGTALVIVVIYRREFRSRTMLMLDEINQAYNESSDDRNYPNNSTETHQTDN